MFLEYNKFTISLQIPLSYLLDDSFLQDAKEFIS